MKLRCWLGLLTSLTIYSTTWAGTGDITANPATCFIPQGQSLCSVTINWNTSGVSDVKIMIQGSMFSTGLVGPGIAPWISETPAVFELWGDGALLKTLTVVGSRTANPPPVVSGITLTANPTSCIIPSGQSNCTSAISWTAPGYSDVKVMIQGNMFSNGPTGSGSAPWISQSPAVFELWGDGILLKTLTVVGTRGTPASLGYISASPTSCIIPEGQNNCSVSINWATNGVNNAKVMIQGMMFAGSNQGTGTAPWISQSPAVFELWGDGVLISKISVVGIPATKFLLAGRSILEPFYATDAASMMKVDHVSKPYDMHSLTVRYQRPIPTDSKSLPFQAPTSFNTAAITGMGPLTDQYQRGPKGGNVPQSVYQLKGNEVGILMRSEDSPHPALLPACQPDCSGYQKHTVYDYRWSTPAPIFSAINPNHSLVIESDIQVPEMRSWSTLDGGPAHGTIAGQLAYVVFLRDPMGHRIQYVIFAFDSLFSNNGDESPALEVIGAGDNGYFISSSFKKNRSMVYTTVDATSQGEFTHSVWSGYKHFRVKITPQNIANAIAELNRRGGQLSTDVYAYRIDEIAMNQEVFSQNNGDAWSMGSSFKNFRVSESP